MNSWGITMIPKFFRVSICKVSCSWLALICAFFITSCDQHQSSSRASPDYSSSETGARMPDRVRSLPERQQEAKKLEHSNMAEDRNGGGTESKQLSKLRKVPYLSFLTDEELKGFLQQLQKKSPSQRASFYNAYPFLAGLPTQQRQVLNDQLANIVPVTVQAKRIVCNCGNDRVKEICLAEDCSEVGTVRSTCEHLCGAGAAVSTVCMPDQECSRH